MSRLSFSCVPFLAMALIGALPEIVTAQTQRVLIKTPKPYTKVVNAITSGGGRITRQFRFIDAIAAEIPVAGQGLLTGLVEDGAVAEDAIVRVPPKLSPLRHRPLATGVAGEDDFTFPTISARGLSLAEVQQIARTYAAAYSLNDPFTHASTLHSAGIMGTGVTVAVIDSGIRPGYTHLTSDSAVVGCEDFVGDGLGCSNSANNPHGTAVAGIITGNALFGFSAASPFRTGVEGACPECFLPVPGSPPNTYVPMIGKAPGASIYVLRAAGRDGSGLISNILAAMERVIELRASGLNVRVANMSLGGPTLKAGGDLYDQATARMLDAGVVPVASAGNAGPSSITISSPGTTLSALTVAAASLAQNERTEASALFGPVFGALGRPFGGVQTAYFSSRGSNADGRLDPDVIGNGTAVYVQGAGPVTSVTTGAGTSFAAPAVAGVVALLAQAFPQATATQLINAIRESANPRIVADGATYLDQGQGYVDAAAARNVLAGGRVSGELPDDRKPTPSVEVNIERSTLLKVRGGVVEEDTGFLKPGQRHELLYRVEPDTTQVMVTLSNVQTTLPPTQQNPFFGDNFLVAIHSAKTSAFPGTLTAFGGDYYVFDYFPLSPGGTWMINDPEPGIVRITLGGDTLAAGSIAGRVRVSSTRQPTPGFTTEDRIANNETIIVPFTVPTATQMAEFRLSWRSDWGSYPTNLLTMYLIEPGGLMHSGGAGVRCPQLVRIANPAPGRWQAIVQGSFVNNRNERFELRVTADSRILPALEAATDHLT